MSTRREDIASVPGFLGWYSLEGAGARPPAGTVDSYENAVWGCAFSRKLSPAQRNLVMEILQETAPVGHDYLWDGSQQGWKLVATVRARVAVRLGKPLLELSPQRVMKLREILGEQSFNQLSSFQEEVVFPVLSSRAEAETFFDALQAAGFDVQLSLDTHYAIVRDLERGASNIMVIEDEEVRANVIRRMLEAGVPLIQRREA